MAANTAEIRHRLAAFDFTGLLVEELGWNHYRASPLEILVDGVRYSFKPAAEKCGLAVYECSPGSDHEIAAYPLRRRIERQVAKLTHEHLIIFVDAARKNQIWQWVRRQSGQPIRYRELAWRAGQTNESLVQVLPAIAFELEEEERLTIVDVASRVQQQVNERVTKKFYDRFREEHKTFLKFIEGIKDTADREWYASLMLNRLMFIYFIQKKGFLDDDRDYLRNRLGKMQQGLGKGHFHRFYRLFLLRLFHEGLGQPDADRSPELAALLGKVPYLNGGLFDVHELERDNPQIQIPDGAFEKIFEFFDAYHWHLDERPLRADNEINPDVLGYIFEKYINQKQMGAYYTKEDITGYISRNTVVLFLLEAARKQCPIAFAADGGVWRLLRNDPDRYIHEVLLKGIDLDLPADIAAGVTDTTKRAGWNRAADEQFALATETWREHVERRQRAHELRRKLSAGEVHSIETLVTLNIDIEQFALDAVSQSEGPELVRAFWNAGKEISALDPACGSGAFLFAALNILERFYSACLDSMQGFVDDLERTERKHHPNALKPFRDVLGQIEHHQNRRYFILKSIVVSNLYGVDIMEEAVEICKLRLFLKLVAQLDSPEQIEPLPDIDFNIRSGNTLVGFTSFEEVRAAAHLLNQEQLRVIDEDAEIADRAFQQFRNQQTQHGLDSKAFANAKRELRRRLDDLRGTLDRYLGQDYVKVDVPKAFQEWRRNYQPFHWVVEFYGIMKHGGFDVVIGNPPWKEYATVKDQYTIKGYSTEPCGNLHGIMTERAVKLTRSHGFTSFIVQLPLTNSSRMQTVRSFLRSASANLHVASFDDRPGKLFEGLQHCRAVIFRADKNSRGDGPHSLFTTRYSRWSTEARTNLFDLLEYGLIPERIPYPGQFPKWPAHLTCSVFEKVQMSRSQPMAACVSKQATKSFIFYQEATQYWVKATVGLPYYAKDGKRGAPAHGRYLYFGTDQLAHTAAAILHSSLFYLYFVAFGDCFHLSETLVRGFLVAQGAMIDSNLEKLGRKLLKDLEKNAVEKTIETTDGHRITYAEYYAGLSKPIIDEIDSALAKHYGLTKDELDFIVNFDIKFRLGQDDASEGEE